MATSFHIPVLLDEVINYLQVQPGKIYLDATLGGGGHTRAILELGGQVIGLDQDPDSLKYVQKTFSAEIQTKKLTLCHGNFALLKQLVSQFGISRLDGILFDLGVSSHQLETPERGFSFNQDAPLDMRQDPVSQTVTAAHLINAGSQKELAGLFWKFGEERDSRRIAAALVAQRKIKPIITTNDLAQIILRVSRPSAHDRTHPATRVFQALRIAVNDELTGLQAALPQAIELINPGGRLVVISFHSLEDRIVKNFMIENSDQLKILTAKPVTPNDLEVTTNPRSRSANLRAAQKIS